MNGDPRLAARVGRAAEKFVLLIFLGSFFTFVAPLVARTASCPCSNPCPCGACTCGGGSKSGGDKTKSGKTDSKHPDERRKGERSHGGGGVGGSINIDLRGVGQREPDKVNPFDVPEGDSTTGRTREKTKTKKPENEVIKTNLFDKINVNQKETKGDIPPADIINVSDEVPQDDKTKEKPKTEEKKPAIDLVEDLPRDEKTEEKPTKNEEKPPPPQTQEKQKKPKPTWPKSIQNWLDLRQAQLDAEEQLKKAEASYYKAMADFCNKSEYLKQLEQKKDEAGKKASAKGATKQDQDAYSKTCDDVEKQKLALERDFANTPEAKAEAEKWNDAKTKVANAKEAEKGAAKDIDTATQNKVLKKMSKWAQQEAGN